MRLHRPRILPTFQRLELRLTNLYKLRNRHNELFVERCLRLCRLQELNAPVGVLQTGEELIRLSIIECKRIRAAITRTWAIWDIKTKSHFADEEKAFTR